MAILGPGNGTLQNGILTDVTSIPSFIPTGTRMIFEQTSIAPTSWTKEITLGNNRALRVTTGTAAPGGSVAFDTIFSPARAVTGTNVAIAAGGDVALGLSAGSVSPGAANIDANSLTVAQLASHTHGYTRNSLNLRGGPVQGAAQVCVSPEFADTTGGAGSNQPHDHASPAHAHGFTHTQHDHGFTGTSHNHTWSGSTNLNVLYLDVIVAVKV